MDKASFERAVREYVENSRGNYIKKEAALRPELGGMKIFDEPLFGYITADDPFFAELKKPGAIGPHFMAPKEWFAGARSVVSMFLPFTAQIRESNKHDMDWPSDEWLHGRIEGAEFQNELCRFIESLLEEEGFAVLVPMLDPRSSSKSPVTQNKEEQDFYTSNWSERHIAYAAGLGTFGLCAGIITAKGAAGRFISAITSVPYQSSGRPYTGVYEYCIKCGACARNCPGKAITVEKGKKHFLCSQFLDITRSKCKPRYGCGKCQVKVPCETGNPSIKNQA
jgi:epoxyqueuosine reductase QueG